MGEFKEPLSDHQRDVFFHRATRANRTRIFAAMTRINGNRDGTAKPRCAL